MSVPLNEIVNVQISRESVNISRTGFGTMLILGGNAAFPERLRYYSDLPSVAEDMQGGVAAPEYLAAQAAFSQNPSVTRIAVGHRGSTVAVTENGGTFTAGTIKAWVNIQKSGAPNVSVSWSTSKAVTMAAFASAIQAIAGIDTASYAAPVLTIIPDSGTVVGLSIDISDITGTMLISSIVTTETEASDSALDSIEGYNNDWYGVVSISRIVADVKKVAAWIEAADKKFFITSSSDPNIINQAVGADVTSIAAVFKNAGYLKSSIIYSASADTQYPDAALFGRILPLDPGSYTAAFKSLAGITVDNLSSTQRENAFAKFVNVYEYVGGMNIVRKGTVSGNEYIDVMIFIDWLDARCTEAVFSVLVSNPKVPFTDFGIASIQNALTAPLKAGQNAGGISPTAYDDQKKQIGGFYIIVPRAQDVSSIDKAARTLNGVKFIAYLAGAIHFVSVNGFVTY
jgi:hypothetical protein